MLVGFLTDTPWQALIYSPRNQNDEACQWNCARNSVDLGGSFYNGRW
jgi:hypothetical protein